MSLSRKVNPGSKCAHVLIKDGYCLTDILIFEANEENQYSVMHCICRGVARIFPRGGGGVTRCLNEVTHQIFMSFLPPVVGCLLKTWLTRGGGGHRHPPPSHATPLIWVAGTGNCLYILNFCMTTVIKKNLSP